MMLSYNFTLLLRSSFHISSNSFIWGSRNFFKDKFTIFLPIASLDFRKYPKLSVLNPENLFTQFQIKYVEWAFLFNKSLAKIFTCDILLWIPYLILRLKQTPNCLLFFFFGNVLSPESHNSTSLSMIKQVWERPW